MSARSVASPLALAGTWRVYVALVKRPLWRKRVMARVVRGRLERVRGRPRSTRITTCWLLVAPPLELMRWLTHVLALDGRGDNLLDASPVPHVAVRVDVLGPFRVLRLWKRQPGPPELDLPVPPAERVPWVAALEAGRVAVCI